MLGVLYPYAQIVPKCNGHHSCVYILYNTLWRGLAELLILVNRQCEGQIRWDKRGSFSHVFFVSVTEVEIRPNQGEGYMDRLCLTYDEENQFHIS